MCEPMSHARFCWTGSVWGFCSSFSLCSDPYWPQCETQALCWLAKNKHTRTQSLLGKRRPAGRSGVAPGPANSSWIRTQIRADHWAQPGPLLWSCCPFPNPLSSGALDLQIPLTLSTSSSHPLPKWSPGQAFLSKVKVLYRTKALLLHKLHPLEKGVETAAGVCPLVTVTVTFDE